MTQAAAVQDFARKLLAQETDASAPLEPGMYATLRAVEKLRLHLGKLVGVSGYQALLARSLALARTEAPWLDAVQIKADGSLDGFVETALQQHPEEATEGGVILLAQLLGLLITLIGETLTLRLVADIWPEAFLTDLNDRNLINFGAEETPS
jgi:hypothetical protein